MGNSTFWYYPDPGNGTLRTIDMGQIVNDMLVPSLDLDQASATALDRTRTIVQWGGCSVSRIRMRWSGQTAAGRTLRRRLVGMLNHLDRGGSVMFAADADRFWAGFMSSGEAGDSSITVVPSMDSIVPDVDLTGQEIVLRSSNPECLIESHIVEAHNDIVLGVQSMSVNPGRIHFDYGGAAWVLVRELGSWPALRLPDNERGRQHLTSVSENVFELDLPVEEDDVSLQHQADAGGGAFSGVEVGSNDPAVIGATSTSGASMGTITHTRGWSF